VTIARNRSRSLGDLRFVLRTLGDEQRAQRCRIGREIVDVERRVFDVFCSLQGPHNSALMSDVNSSACETSRCKEQSRFELGGVARPTLLERGLLGRFSTPSILAQP
jgi:hypothetical protein